MSPVAGAPRRRMSVLTQFGVAASVTMAQAVSVGAAVALRDRGLDQALYLVALITAWFVAPTLAVRIVRVFHPDEFRGSSIPTVVAVVGVESIALALWMETLAPLLGLDCGPRILGCPLPEVVKSMAAVVAVMFLAAFGGVSLVASFQGRRPAQGPPGVTGT